MDENFCNSARAVLMSVFSCVQSRPAYFSCDTYEAEILSGRVAHAAKVNKDTAAKQNLNFEFIDMIFLIKMPIKWVL